jgi:hypothetical protein
MAATVLNSKRAMQMSLFVVRAFVRLREMIRSNRAIALKLAELERRLENHDDSIQVIALRQLMLPKPVRRVGISFQLPATAGTATVQLSTRPRFSGTTRKRFVFYSPRLPMLC